MRWHGDKAKRSHSTALEQCKSTVRTEPQPTLSRCSTWLSETKDPAPGLQGPHDHMDLAHGPHLDCKDPLLLAPRRAKRSPGPGVRWAATSLPALPPSPPPSPPASPLATEPPLPLMAVWSEASPASGTPSEAISPRLGIEEVEAGRGSIWGALAVFARWEGSGEGRSPPGEAAPSPGEAASLA